MLYRALIIVFILLSGCGYHFRRTEPWNPAIKNIFIEAVRNDTKEVGIERFFTTSIYNQFTRSHIFNITSKENADAFLETTITSYSVTPAFFTSEGAAIGYRLTVSVRSVLRGKDRMVILDSKKITVEDDYFLESNILDTKRNEYKSLQYIADDIAEEIHDFIVEGKHE